MIVMIDTKTQNILLYKENGLVKIPFTEAADIFEIIGNKKVMYVTNVMNAGANDIIGLIQSMGIKTISAAEMSDNKYIHGIDEGTIYLREGLKFEGKYDCKLIDRDMKNILLGDHLMKKLISTGKLEIIGEVARRKLSKRYKKFLEGKVESQKKSDEKLSSIIMDTRVDDWDGTINVNDHVGAIEIDITPDVQGAGSEILDKMDGK